MLTYGLRSSDSSKFYAVGVIGLGPPTGRRGPGRTGSSQSILSQHGIISLKMAPANLCEHRAPAELDHESRGPR